MATTGGPRLCACGAFALAIVRTMPLPHPRLHVSWISNGFTGQPAFDILLGDVMPMALALLAATAIFESSRATRHGRRDGEGGTEESILPVFHSPPVATVGLIRCAYSRLLCRRIQSRNSAQGIVCKPCQMG